MEDYIHYTSLKLSQLEDEIVKLRTELNQDINLIPITFHFTESFNLEPVTAEIYKIYVKYLKSLKILKEKFIEYKKHDFDQQKVEDRIFAETLYLTELKDNLIKEIKHFIVNVCKVRFDYDSLNLDFFFNRYLSVKIN